MLKAKITRIRSVLEVLTEMVGEDSGDHPDEMVMLEGLCRGIKKLQNPQVEHRRSRGRSLLSKNHSQHEVKDVAVGCVQTET